jgi:tetratricopeptide (TPR) repeat protein
MVTPNFGLAAFARFTDYNTFTAGLGAVVEASANLGGASSPSSATSKPPENAPQQPKTSPKPLSTSAPGVEIVRLDLPPVFPVFYKFYDDHPMGTLVIRNNFPSALVNMSVKVYVKQYMDDPKEIDFSDALAPGDSKTLDLFALFTNRVLDITEGTKASAEIDLGFEVNGKAQEIKKIETVTFLGRNAMTWDDNRKAAAYVTAKDPAVLIFARSITGYVRAKETRSINVNLQAAIALHEALDLYGLNYVPNPQTPYSVVSQAKDRVDFLQFPRETFQYRAGDCSDISILYSALLAAVAIDSAFITIPGHVFVAVSTGLTPDQARQILIPENQFIEHENKAWIPVEITLRHQGFLKAWALGAKEWRENQAAGQAGFYPVLEAWDAFQAVGLPGADNGAPSVPSSEQVQTRYLSEMQKYIDQATAPEVSRLQSEIKKTGSVAAMNSLGVLYAKYGQSDNAEEQFTRALKQKTYLPAIINLGNLSFIKEDWAGALRYYKQANDIAPGVPHVLLALARTDLELQNYNDARNVYEKLKKIDPVLADQFSYLGESQNTGTRSADVEAERLEVYWESE